MALSTPPTTPSNSLFRSRLLALIVAVTAIVLTACGAEVNSQLALERDYSGERSFVLTMAADDADQLEGGVDAAEQALAARTPDMLIFQGIESADEGYSARFDMPFADPQDYEQKINELLEFSEVPEADRVMTVAADTTALVSSLVIEEEFYNDDLMGWVAPALASEDVISTQHSVFTSGGSTTVTLDGQEITTSTSLPRAHFRLHDDHRFDDVALDLEFAASGELRVRLSYLISSEDAHIQNTWLDTQIEALQQLHELTDRVDDSGTLTPGADSASQYRQIDITFPTAATVAPAMQLLLANEHTSWEVQERTNADDPTMSVEYVGEDWTCPAICNPTNLQQLHGETTYPEHWDLTTDQRDDGRIFLEFNHGIPLESVTSSTQLTLTGAVRQTFDFVVDSETIQSHEESISQLFRPPTDLGTFTETQQGATTRYSATFEGDNAAELTEHLSAYFAAKGIDRKASVTHGSLSGLWASYDVHVDVAPIWELASGSAADTGVFTIDLPVLHSPNSANTFQNEHGGISIDDASGDFVVSASGPTQTTLWLAGLSVLLVSVLMVLLVRTRRASLRVWSIATDKKAAANDQAFNVQGPRDELTATDIYASPLAPAQDMSETVEFHGPALAPADQPSKGPVPFPDVPHPKYSEGLEHQGLDTDDPVETTTDPTADNEQRP